MKSLIIDDDKLIIQCNVIIFFPEGIFLSIEKSSYKAGDQAQALKFGTGIIRSVRYTTLRFIFQMANVSSIYWRGFMDESFPYY